MSSRMAEQAALFHHESSRRDFSLEPIQKELIIKGERGKEYRCWRELREYRRDTGEPICQAMVDIREEPTPVESNDPALGHYEGHQLDAVVLVHSQTFKTYDLLQRFNHNNISIIIDALVEQTGWGESPRDEIVIPPLKSPLEIAYLLHERRHGQQFRELNWRPLISTYYDWSAEDARGKPYEELAPAVAAIRRALPHLPSLPPDRAYELLDLPEQVTERAAERGTLEALDAVQAEADINLLVPFWWEPSQLPDTSHLRAHWKAFDEDSRRLSATDKELHNPYFRLAGPTVLSIEDVTRRYLLFLDAVQGKMFGGGDGRYDLEERLGLDVATTHIA